MVEAARGQALRERAGGRVRGQIEGGTSSTSKLTGFDIVRLINCVKQIGMKIGAYHQDGLLIPKLLGVLDKPVTAPTTNRRQRPGAQKSSGFETIAESPLFLRGEIGKESDKISRSLPALLGRDAEVNRRLGR